MRSPRLLMSLGLCVLLASASMFSADPAAAIMATAATRFLAGLTPEQKQKAAFPLDSPEWTHWHFIPNETFARHGVTLKEMTPLQRETAHALLRSGLSQHGYLTATNIISLETVLRALENDGQFARDPEQYWFAVFGTPSPKGSWGWRFEGHHVSLHITVVNGALSVSTPTFFGSNPAEVRTGDKKGLRVLGFIEDPARALLNSLTDVQRGKALLPGPAPGDILTMNKFPIEALAPAGVLASELNPKQRELLMAVVEAYTAQMTSEIAALRMSHLGKAGIEKLAFAWAGEAEKGKKHYYRVQGPTFLIEYDNTQNDANHVHSVWRDFEGDFGRDLLREHLRNSAH